MNGRLRIATISSMVVNDRLRPTTKRRPIVRTMPSVTRSCGASDSFIGTISASAAAPRMACKKKHACQSKNSSTSEPRTGAHIGATMPIA